MTDTPETLWVVRCDKGIEHPWGNHDPGCYVPVEPCEYGNYAPHLALVDDEKPIKYSNVYECDGKPDHD